jgi:hypothetical protein
MAAREAVRAGKNSRVAPKAHPALDGIACSRNKHLSDATRFPGADVEKPSGFVVAALDR